jgi:hypothetical protein
MLKGRAAVALVLAADLPYARTGNGWRFKSRIHHARLVEGRRVAGGQQR